MSANLMTRFKRLVSGEDLEHDMYGIDELFDSEQMMYGNQQNEEEMIMMTERPKRQKRNLRLVDHNEAATMGGHAEVVVLEPQSFDDSLEIVEHLREQKSVVLNLHHLDTVQSQRVVDFLSGATHAIDGHQQRIGDGVFIFTPQSVNICNEQEKRMSSFEAGGIWK